MYRFDNGIVFGRWQPKAVINHDRFGLARNDLPGTRDCDVKTMVFPLHIPIDNEDYAYVIKAIRDLA